MAMSRKMTSGTANGAVQFDRRTEGTSDRTHRSCGCRDWQGRFPVENQVLDRWETSPSEPYRPDLPITIASFDLVVADTITHMSRDTYVYRVIRRCLS